MGVASNPIRHRHREENFITPLERVATGNGGGEYCEYGAWGDRKSDQVANLQFDSISQAAAEMLNVNPRTVTSGSFLSP